MEDTITTHFALCDDFLKASGHRDDPQCRLSTAEVMTVALTAASFFSGNIERSRVFLREHGYMRATISKSRPDRRLHAIPLHVWESLFAILAEFFKESNASGEYAVDSFPVAVCENRRISRRRIYKGERLRGRAASRGGGWFYGLRARMLVGAGSGEPMEFHLEPGSANDNPPFKGFALDLAEGSVVYADKQYNDYHCEDLLKEAASIGMGPLRKRNSKRPFEARVEYIQKKRRKRVETAFSQIVGMIPRRIHAVTSRCFELKIACFILAFAIQFI